MTISNPLTTLSKRVVVTSALPYVSGSKHLGNLIGSILPADVHARFRRLLGHDVAFVCGTDEHGSPAELAALAAGLTPCEYCEHAHAVQAREWAALNISFDHFGRTSSPVCTAEAQAEFTALHAHGLLQETRRLVPWGTVSNRFLPDRLVKGKCPHCCAPAKGDGCDACGAALEASDLVNPTSTLVPGETVILKESRHFALDLPCLKEAVEADIASKPYSAFVRAESGNWLHDLQARDITRDTAWGVPVPLDGWDGKTLYVWFDAPIAYWGLLREWATGAQRDVEDFLEDGVDWTAFLAKDNVSFHTTWFPAIALGGRGLPTPNRISGHGWLLAGDGKFSTSGGSGLTVAEALARYPADALRWWLCANAPEDGVDRAWTESAFIQGCNATLANNFGNLVARIGAVASGLSSADSSAVFDTQDDSADAVALFDGVRECVHQTEEALSALSTRRACAALERGWSLCNAYLAASAPWSTGKADPALARRQIRTAVAATSWVTRAAFPIIPDLTTQALKALGDQDWTGAWPGLRYGDTIGSVHVVHPRRAAPLLPRLVAKD